jgi:hypothetical protein
MSMYIPLGSWTTGTVASQKSLYQPCFRSTLIVTGSVYVAAMPVIVCSGKTASGFVSAHGDVDPGQLLSSKLCLLLSSCTVTQYVPGLRTRRPGLAVPPALTRVVLQSVCGVGSLTGTVQKPSVVCPSNEAPMQKGCSPRQNVASIVRPWADAVAVA